ncbi:5'-3' exoribonuclease 1 isoform X2 [Macrosteles quadrilineatus]|uniref:5'-3' exoribonuclease 1 isoform X2 n=1 Tax=Macrosteles quadrilineatus TaxID=74068 RepID=UPI0023E26B2E|nr:5'-3' exoribonuclease 1 isoform X2 [Macrosteles quadrilineatus]
MGVPKFFRYISERYPCLSEVVREYQLPEFDNLYLDMNGIIHICSHPNDADPHFRITEEKIFRDIFHYIETLFRMIQPQKLFFMAVDGVAPRAKMNQQRGRRFRSAKDAEMAEARAREKGEVLPSAERFDSNCITPGTEFMTRLQAQLKYFVTLKMSSDKLWQKAKVILSGHEVPGEGEHKIMEYIRYMKSQPDYDPNTRHCLYGLDADLIMLGLCTHEPHFSLLREEVKYGKKNNQKRIPTPEETTFFLLHLSLMREYLDLEFQALKTALPFPYDLEHIIDDWVLMGFLVGNDFIPHLPDLHINKGALPILYRTYIEVLPTLGGYINEGGHLRLERFQKYMEKLAAFDFEQFKEINADLKYLESKTGRKSGRHSNEEEEEELPSPPKNKDLAALIASTAEYLEGSEDDEEGDSDDEEGTSFTEFCAHKNNYYREKLEYDNVTPEVLRDQAEGYVRAIQWNLNYYYNGCCSWSWFYPHHYAPYISDIRNFSELKLEYDLGQPFLPFQQLLAVLPAASKKLLPEPYHDLMEDDKSPIIDFYPKDFRTDLNGKKQDWEALVLIPFIEQKSLLNAMETKENQLSEEEQTRNKHGPMQIYTYTPERLGAYISPAYFPALVNNHAKEENVYREQLFVEECRLIKGLCPNVKLDVYFVGFPTLKHIPFTAKLKKAKVKVFESPSQGDNMILHITPEEPPDVADVASQLLGNNIYVNWPHMFEAKVVAVASSKTRYILKPEDNSIQSEEMNTKLASQWSMTKQGIEDRYMDRMGIDIGPTEVLVYACTLEDRKCVLDDNGTIHTEKQFGKLPVAYALQTTRANLSVQESPVPDNLTLEKMFPVESVVFSLSHFCYGFKATVEQVVDNVRVKVTTSPEPKVSLVSIKQNQEAISPHLMSAQEISRFVGLSNHIVSRITGTIFILAAEQQQETDRKPFKLNIGLNLKFNRRNEEVYGYTKRDKNGYWYYSTKTMQEILDYKEKFPEVFAYLTKYPGFDDVHANQLYPENTVEKLAELATWLKERGSCSAERQSCGAEVLDEAVVAAIEKYIDNMDPDLCVKAVTFDAKPSSLYIPKPKLGQAPDPRASHRLYDRVVNIRESHTVPLGARGTIIGIHDADKGPQAMYDIVFDKPFTGGLKLRCSPHRGYRLPAQAFINCTYGLVSEIARSGKTVTSTESNEAAGGVSNNNNNGHSSAFASWRNKPNSDIGGSPNKNGMVKQRPRGGGGDTDNRSPRHQYNLQQLQSSGAAELNLRPEKAGTPKSLPQAPAPPQQHPGLNQLSNEFLAMFKQLQKAGNNSSQPKPAVNAQDSSEALKKMLRIVDDTSSIPTTAQQPPNQHQQPTRSSHQQQSVMPVHPQHQPAMPLHAQHQPAMPLHAQHQSTMPLHPQQQRQPTSYVKSLMSLHQTRGVRLPQYHYLDLADGTITCTVVCGNGKEFKGQPAYTSEQAAENAAVIALQSLVVEESYAPSQNMLPGRMMLAMDPSGRGPKRYIPPNNRMAGGWTQEPPTVTLPQPPVKWYQNKSFQPEWQSKPNGLFQLPTFSHRFPGQNHHSPLPPFPQAGVRPPFIPLQALSRTRQQPQPAPPPQQPPANNQEPRQVRQHQPPAKKENQGQRESKPASSGRNSTRPPRSRLAANFSKPLKFDSPSESSQDT